MVSAILGVRTRPGATAFARIPSRPHRDATWRTIELMPAFDTPYDGRCGSPMWPAAELV